MNEEKCKFGECQHYWNCKDRKGKCKKFKPCESYMDQYDNDIELWEDLHGEGYSYE